MYSSFGFVAVTPRGVVTVTSTVPVPAGAVARTIFGETTLTLRGRIGTEVHGRGPVEVLARDGHYRPACRRALAGSDVGDYGRHGRVGELVPWRWRSCPEVWSP